MREERQFHCPSCGESKLFARELREAPHLIHLLMTLLTCGLWIVIWFLDACLTAIANVHVPFRCQTCGSAPGRYQATPKIKHTGAEAAYYAEIRRGYQRRRTEKWRRRGKRWRETTDKLAQLLSDMPRQINVVLWRLAGGRENELLHGFFVCMLIAGTIGAGIILIGMLTAF